MCRFIETIRVDCGEVRNTAYHERRMNDTRTHFWPESPALQLAGYLLAKHWKVTPEYYTLEDYAQLGHAPPGGGVFFFPAAT